MALTKPILSPVTSWDVTKGYTFEFDVVGGDQVTGNTLTIRNNETNEVVFTQLVTSFAYKNIVSPNASGLQNGVYYNAYIETINVNGEISAKSNIIQFYCYATPNVSITNITDGGRVYTSSPVVQATYSQASGELLKSYEFNLYSDSGRLVDSSGIIYASTDSVSIDVSYKFVGLSDGATYAVQVIFSTINGTIVSTSLVNFTVFFEIPQNYADLTVVNNCAGGYITIGSNVSLIEGHTNLVEPIEYIDGTKVNLKGGKYVRWENGYNIANNATWKIWFEYPDVDATILEWTNGGDTCKLDCIVYSDDVSKIIYRLMVSSGFGTYYVIFSDPIETPMPDVAQCIQVRNIDNLYDLIWEVVE